MVHGGKGDIGDWTSGDGGDSEVAGKYAVGADIAGESVVGVGCKPSCGMPVLEKFDPSLFGRGVNGLG